MGLPRVTNSGPIGATQGDINKSSGMGGAPSTEHNLFF